MSGLNGRSFLKKVNTEPSYLHEVPLGNNQESRNKRIVSGVRISSNVGITNDEVQRAIAREKFRNGMRKGSSGANSSTAAAKGGKRTRKYRKTMNKRKTRSYRK